MPFSIIRQDLTKLSCDAIVNAANRTLLGGGGVDGAIHRAAGPALLEECKTLGGCEVGQAKLTFGYALPAKYVIHTVGPVWQGGIYGEHRQLAACYENSLKLAQEKGFSSIAFPLISAGAYGFPKEVALDVAVSAIGDFLLRNESEMDVSLVIFDRESFTIGKKRFETIRAYIDDRYTAGYEEIEARRRASAAREENIAAEQIEVQGFAAPQMASNLSNVPKKEKKKKFKKGKIRAESIVSDASIPGDLSEYLKTLDESFSEMLLRKIDEKGMKDSECYKKANIDRKLFSKIRTDPQYRPSKPTAMAFAVALELPMIEAVELLQKAGYAFSPSSRFDLIIEYFIEKSDYNIFEINEALFAFDQPLLGGF